MKRLIALLPLLCGIVAGFMLCHLFHKPRPPLYFEDGAWHTDGSAEMTGRAMNGWRLGDTIYMPEGTYSWKPWNNGGTIKEKPPAIVEAHDNTFPSEEEDHEDIYAEIPNNGEAGMQLMWAIRSDPTYKWAELRWKDPEGKILLVVRHTKPKKSP